MDAPLGGLAYAVSGYGGLPHVVFILAGQVMVIPQGESKQTGRGLRTEVPVVPDVPIGHFRLTLFGGKQGYLANTRDLCGHTPVVEVAFGGQNGRSRTQRIKVSAACGDSKHRAAPSPLAVFESAKSLNRP